MNDLPWLVGVDRADYPAAAAEERRNGARSTTRDAGPGYRALADRPSRRRSSEIASSATANRVTVRARRVELRESGDGGNLLTFEGWASVTEAPYEMWDWAGPYTEQVMKGAFTKTLAQTEPPLDVPLVLQHDALRRIARTTNGSLELTEDEVGLHTLASQLDPADADVAYIAPKLRSGLIDEMSFKFMITKGSWSPDWMEYHIDEVDLHRGDVAIVAYGANPATSGGLRAARSKLTLPADLSPDEAREWMNAFRQQYPDLAERSARRGADLISAEEVKPRVL